MKNTALQIGLLTIIAGLIVWSSCFYEQPQMETTTPAPEMSVAEKKARFAKLLVPAVDKVYDQLSAEYDRISMLIEEGGGDAELAALRKQYRVETNADLLVALKPHPKSIALAQAAMESSWATSRFFRMAKNVFGVWSFDKQDARIEALEKRGDKTIWVKKYPTIEASIRDYYRTLARGKAFDEFRKLKMETDDPFKLVKKLDRYSERGAEYGSELAAVIRQNNFTEYDN
ncbi:MAG: glucosaminidase domain-containing protein [Desulfuromonas sp.]|nr:glucosaminidase domain-containing protein [Desulfuromonas sp.]